MLGLESTTDGAWVHAALTDPIALLADHAHCELKAATTALSLATRHADHPDLVRSLTALAEEEIGHFRRAFELLCERGATLGPPPVDVYAARLRKAIPGATTLVDRLLVAALIEARSCERFRLLADHAADPALRALWGELLASEAGHYRAFLDLAMAEGAHVGLTAEVVRAKHKRLAEAEAEIVRTIALEAGSGPRASVHG